MCIMGWDIIKNYDFKKRPWYASGLFWLKLVYVQDIVNKGQTLGAGIAI